MATDDPRLSWTTIVGAVVIVGLINSAQWVVSRTQFDNVEKQEAADRATFDHYLTVEEHRAYSAGVLSRLEGLSARVATLEKQQADTFSRLAHDPVEDRTFQAVSTAVDKRIDLIKRRLRTSIGRLPPRLLLSTIMPGKKWLRHCRRNRHAQRTVDRIR